MLLCVVVLQLKDRNMLPLEKMLSVQMLIRDKVNYKTANVFGLIAYTVENPHVVKALRDQDYWASLNSRTENWILYAIHPDSRYGHLVEEYILPQLGVEKKDDLPLLIVFAIGPNGQYLQRSYAIDDRNEQTAYNSIASIVKTITETVRGIFPEYLSSTGVIREVKKNLEAELAKEQWRKVTSEMKKLVETLFISAVAGEISGGFM